MTSKFTVVDKIVGDSLAAADSYREQYQYYKPVVGGGIATQLYTYPNFPDLLRPTSDLDLFIKPKLNPAAFRNAVGKNLAKLLEEYKPQVSVLRHVYEVKTEDKEGHQFFIHSYKWTENNWEREKNNVERQVSNASPLSIPNLDRTVYTVRPEDILADKVRRLGKTEEQCKIPTKFNGNYRAVRNRNWDTLGEQDLNEWLPLVVQQKNRLPGYFDRGEDEFRNAVNEYRVYKDLFDISLLVKLASNKKIDFDEAYLSKIIDGVE